jgi:3-methyladenine DNA glycosylase/8-oxoguanine DNA glycosylase
MILNLFPHQSLDFKKTFDSGLFYFFYEDEPIRKIYFKGKFLDIEVSQENNALLVEMPGLRKENLLLAQRIKYCLGLDEELSSFYKICRKDPVLKGRISDIENTRIISAFSDFEALVGAIISQNNSYKNYRKKMLEVYQKWNFVPENFTERNLKDMGLGYKVPFLVNLAKDFGKKNLAEIHGIGPYSRQLFEIFQKKNYSAFYMDCLTEKIMRERYGITKDFEAESWRLWGKWRGLAEAYLQRFFEKK